jgi:hypothetical protein
MVGITSRSSALAVVVALLSTLAPMPSFADSGTTLQRVEGTVGFVPPGGSRTDVTTSSGMPASAETFSQCSSAAVLNLTSDTNVVIGGATRFLTPAQNGAPATLHEGALEFNVPGQLSPPLVIATSYGTVTVTHGSGYIVAGQNGMQTIVPSSQPADVKFSSKSGPVDVPGGHALTAGATGPARPVAVSTVNNPAVYQFNGGRNPLGTDGTAAVYDPTSSPTPNCKIGAPAAAGLGAAGALLALAGAAGAAVAIGTLHGGGGDPSGAATATPSGGATATPSGGGSTSPTASPSSGASSNPSASPSSGACSPGPVALNPGSTLLSPGIGQPATATFAVSQSCYGGAFTVTQPVCAVGLLGLPAASIAGNTVTVTLPAQGAALSLFCSVTVTGGGGQTATEPIDIVITVLGPGPSPSASGSSSPSPGPSGTGPLTATPTSILLNVSAGAPATQNIIVSPPGDGPFTATTTCAVPLGSPPLTSVTGNVVTITAPAQLLTAPVLCDTVITSPSTGQSVTVLVTITGTAIAPATPTPSPNPSGIGPLFAVPSSILLNPGVTTEASQNIEIFDHGFAGTYAVSLAPGCLALQQPVVTLVNGNIANITVPGQILNVALLCSVTISDGTSTISVPVTISATALAELVKHVRLAGIAFSPAVLTLNRAGETQTVEIFGEHGPYRASAACGSRTSLETQISGDRATIRATTIGTDGVCMVTITGAGSAYGQIPVGLKAGPRLESVGHPGTIALSAPALALRPGQHQSVLVSGTGPFVLAGSCGRVATAVLNGRALEVFGRAAGACSLGLRDSDGSQALISIVVTGSIPKRAP